MISTLENFVDKPKALVVFAHGAGADKSHAFMEKFTELLNSLNLNVLRFNFPYMDKRLIDGKRRPPDKMPALLTCIEEVIAGISTSLPVFIIGKSMGGRVAATFAEQAQLNIKGIVCIGYPFHPQKKPEKLRLEPLQNTKKPILILQGDRDPLGNKSEAESYKLSSFCKLKFFTDGDHDLKPRVKSGFKQEQHLNTAIEHIESFINEHQ